jgi:GINS complex subunit 1
MAENRQFCELATQLVTESRRSTATDTLFKYNDPLIRQILREQRQLEALIQSALSSSDSDTFSGESPALLIYQVAILRNKRCLLAYHSHRIDRLKDLFWSVGGALPHLLSSSDIRNKLSPHEVDFMKKYNSHVMDFRSEFSDELDIMAGITEPPKDLNVLVKVVKDCGVIQTELGSIDFQRGQRFMVRRADIEHLIVQGYLEEV